MAGALGKSVDYGFSVSFQDTKGIINQQIRCEFIGKVKVVDRLKYGLTALRKLFDRANPMNRILWGKYVCTSQYGFGDALGSGFDASWEDQGGEKKYWKGNWGNNMAGKSSNLCELKNPKEALDILAREGRLTGLKFFIFTDNTATEAAYLNSTSFSSELSDCVIRLRLLDISHQCKIHIFHVSGDRMIN